MLMAWLNLPGIQARFAASCERVAQGERATWNEALSELGLTEEQIAAAEAQVEASEQAS